MYKLTNIMGTNYYRIPQASEMDERKFKLLEKIKNLDLSPGNIECGFDEPIDDQWGRENPWGIFIDGTNIHLGKRSSGWKFCWNFHKDKYYSNKEELLSFIRSGRIVDEWGEPDGLVVNQEYRRKERTNGMGSFFDKPEYDDKIIDGLRVSSSTDFC